MTSDSDQSGPEVTRRSLLQMISAAFVMPSELVSAVNAAAVPMADTELAAAANAAVRYTALRMWLAAMYQNPELWVKGPLAEYDRIARVENLEASEQFSSLSHVDHAVQTVEAAFEQYRDLQIDAAETVRRYVTAHPKGHAKLVDAVFAHPSMIPVIEESGDWPMDEAKAEYMDSLAGFKHSKQGTIESDIHDLRYLASRRLYRYFGRLPSGLNDFDAGAIRHQAIDDLKGDLTQGREFRRVHVRRYGFDSDEQGNSMPSYLLRLATNASDGRPSHTSLQQLAERIGKEFPSDILIMHDMTKPRRTEGKLTLSYCDDGLLVSFPACWQELPLRVMQETLTSMATARESPLSRA